MPKIEQLTHLNSLSYIDQKGSKHKIPVEVDYDQKKELLHISPTGKKTARLVMDIKLTFDTDSHNRSLCDYRINYMDDHLNLDGMEFGKAYVESKGSKNLALRALNNHFLLEKS